jgi:hypothetical protein
VRAAGLIREPQRIERRWRHTFGAERQGPARVMFDTTTIGADVVLVQGVQRVRDVRLLFPARAWRLVVSREILAPGETPKPTTAIVVRYRKGLRVTAQEHLMELAAPAPVGHAEGASAAGAAGTAVRVLVGDKPFWLASVSLNVTCAKPQQICPTRQKLEAWIADKAATGATAVFGGRGAATAAGAQSLASCGDQSIARMPAAAPSVTAAQPADIREGDGCLITVGIE